MAQKANAYALRLGINQNWNSNYFLQGNKQFLFLKQDKDIRDYTESLSREIVQIRIERSAAALFLFISATDVNFLTDKNGERLANLVKEVQKIVDDQRITVKVHLIEVKKAFCDAKYIANLIASRIKGRTPFRVALRTTISKVTPQKEIKGFKIKISGRLDGSEIAKTEKVSIGKVPLSTLISVIDFATAEAKTTYGKIGISVWLYKGKQRSLKVLPTRSEIREQRRVNTEEN